MIHIRLTSEQRDVVMSLRRDPTLSSAERDRVEMILLTNQGWSVPQIASHLGYCLATVRRLFRQFTEEGLGALRHKPPGPPKDTVRTHQVQTALTTLLSQERTWTATQLAHALQEQAIYLSARQLPAGYSRLASHHAYAQAQAGLGKACPRTKDTCDPQKKPPRES